MKNFYLVSFLFLTSCNTLPQLYQAAEDIADDKAIELSISRESMQKDTNVKVIVDVINTSQK